MERASALAAHAWAAQQCFDTGGAGCSCSCFRYVLSSICSHAVPPKADTRRGWQGHQNTHPPETVPRPWVAERQGDGGGETTVMRELEFGREALTNSEVCSSTGITHLGHKVQDTGQRKCFSARVQEWGGSASPGVANKQVDCQRSQGATSRQCAPRTLRSMPQGSQGVTGGTCGCRGGRSGQMFWYSSPEGANILLRGSEPVNRGLEWGSLAAERHNRGRQVQDGGSDGVYRGWGVCRRHTRSIRGSNSRVAWTGDPTY